MNSKKKMFVAGAMAAAFAVSGQFVQFDIAGTPSFGSVKTAEAGLGSLGGLAKTVAGKALKVDVDSLQGNKESMLLNLYKASLYYAEAAIDVSEALGLDDGQLAQMKAAMNNLQNDKTNLGAMKKVSETTKLDPAVVEQKSKALMDSGDQDKINKANELIKKSKSARQAANKYKLLAGKDAAKIISGSAKALASGSSLGDKLQVVQELSSTAKSAKSVTDAIGSNHKDLTTALKAYEKQNNIGAVSDDQAEKDMKNAGLS